MKDTIGARYAILSFASITLTAILTALHHIYRLGLDVALPAAIIVLLPYVLMRWFQHTGNKGVFGPTEHSTY